MTEPQKKSRRRFLADLLFLGGGVSAAALLAKSQFLSPDSTPEPPATLGAACPTELCPDSVHETPTVSKSPECAPMPGEPIPPYQFDGNMVLPEHRNEQLRSKGDVASPEFAPPLTGEPAPPKIEGGER